MAAKWNGNLSVPADALPQRWLGSGFRLVMDRLVGGDPEKGLAKLKPVLEKQA